MKSDRKEEEDDKDNFSEDTLVNKELSFLELPHDIITRVLFFSVDNCEGDKTNKLKIQNLLNFLYTCKYAYKSFRYIIYTLKPINIRNGCSSKKGTKAESFIDPCILESMLADQMICKKVKVLNYFARKGFVGERIGSIKINQSTAHQMNRSGVDKFFLSNMYKFSSLLSFNIVSSNPNHIKFLLNAPPSLLRFQFSLDMKNSLQDFLHTKENFDETEELIKSFRSRKCHSKLEYFKITSNKSIMHSKVHSFFLVNKINIPQDTSEFLKSYFSMSTVRQFEKIRKRKMGNIILLGKLIFEILSANRDTLKLVEFEKFDVALALSNDNLNPKLSFPNLRVLLFDTVSYMRMELWLKKFQLDNLSLRNGKPLFLVMINTISDILMTKTATSVLSEMDDQMFWSTMANPGKALIDIKKELNIFV